MINSDDKARERDSRMIDFDNKTGETIKDFNPKWWQIPDHPYITLRL